MGDTDPINLQLSQRDYILILGVLRESATVIPDRELRTRIATTEAELAALGTKIRAQGSEQGAGE